MKTLSKYVIGTIIYALAFITVNEIIFCVYGAIPDTLVTCGLGGGVIELVITFLLKSASDKEKKNDKAWTDSLIDEDEING